MLPKKTVPIPAGVHAACMAICTDVCTILRFCLHKKEAPTAGSERSIRRCLPQWRCERSVLLQLLDLSRFLRLIGEPEACGVCGHLCDNKCQCSKHAAHFCDPRKCLMLHNNKSFHSSAAGRSYLSCQRFILYHVSRRKNGLWYERLRFWYELHTAVQADPRASRFLSRPSSIITVSRTQTLMTVKPKLCQCSRKQAPAAAASMQSRMQPFVL